MDESQSRPLGPSECLVPKKDNLVRHDHGGYRETGPAGHQHNSLDVTENGVPEISRNIEALRMKTSVCSRCPHRDEEHGASRLM